MVAFDLRVWVVALVRGGYDFACGVLTLFGLLLIDFVGFDVWCGLVSWYLLIVLFLFIRYGMRLVCLIGCLGLL